MKRLFIVLLILFALIKGCIYVPIPPGHKLIAKKTFHDVSYNVTVVWQTLEDNGWRYKSGGGIERSIHFSKSESYEKVDGVSLQFLPHDETSFSFIIIVWGKDENEDRKVLNQTLDELYQIFGWDMSGFKTTFSVESD